MNPAPADPVVHLFGGPYVTTGSGRQEVPAGSRRLLAFVALHRRPVERRHAAAVLWPAMPATRAGGNLRSALWRLRGAGIDAVTADQCFLALAPRVAVDVHAVREWATRLIEGHPSPADLALSPSSTEALDLMPGCYDDWALIERERLRQRILRALEALSRHLVAVSRFGDAIDAAMIAVHAEPLRESAQRALVEAHLAEGNVVEARRAYRAYALLLHREVGAGPAPELTALVSCPDVRWSDPPAVLPAVARPHLVRCCGADRTLGTTSRRNGHVTRRCDDRPMAGKYEASRVGVCVVRAETDASAKLLITVTARRDVDDSACESVMRTATVDAALACVADFLASVKQEEP